MKYDFSGLSVCAIEGDAMKAAELFSEEIQRRTGVRPSFRSSTPLVKFAVDTDIRNKDTYILSLDGSVLTVRGSGIRALIFGYSYFLRKTTYNGEKITLIKNISGTYTPDKTVRGHQLGYRDCNNTYDAWDIGDYRRYYLDIMTFGSNTVEHIPDLSPSSQNSLMKYSSEELCLKASALADEFDLDVSLWFPNDELDIEESVRIRKKFFEKCPRLNIVFPPGGDPGDFPGDEFVDRSIAISKALKEVKPDAQMWPSAQQPHAQISWGEDFIERMSSLPDEIDGIITGPNRAYPIDMLRRLLPMKYPIRLYPDVTHNVRCEYPVHFDRDDWHYSLTSALSRECVNPRPSEYRTIHRLTSRYTVGSVSYSDGSNDDLNKMVWGDMEFFPNVPLRDTLLDYARAFLWEASAEKVADGISGLEYNWYGDPAENPHIESTLSVWKSILSDCPHIIENWRFCQFLFRAECDALVRRRRLFELSLLDEMRVSFSNGGSIDDALNILSADYDNDYKQLHDDIFSLADRLYKLIGMQLDIETYHAAGWERGATLTTLDLPVTDRAWFISRLNYALTLEPEKRDSFISGLLNRNTVKSDEFYFSLAEHGFDVLGERQQGEFYLNFQGDRPNVNNGSIPMSQLKLYDHFSFRCKLGGFAPDTDYKLRISFSSSRCEFVKSHTVTANGIEIYKGKQFGGEADSEFDKNYLAPKTETATYLLPSSVFQNGCIDLVISEPTVGVMMSEFWIIKA